MSGQAPSLAGFLVLIAAYLGLNSSLNMLNKWALGVYGFRFPFLLTSTHMLFSFCALAPIAMRESIKVHRHTLERQWKGVVYIGMFLALNIALNNVSLLDISLSLNQIIRSSIPVVTCVLAIVVENRQPSHAEALSLIVLVLGVMLAVWQGTVTGKPYAIACCLAATFSNGAMMTFSGKVLSEKLDVVKLTFYTAPVSLLCLLPFTLIYEKHKFAAYYRNHTQGVWGIMVVTSINALAYNMVHSLMIKKTSAVTTTVLGEVKIVGLLVLSAMFLGEGKEFTVKMSIGCALAMIGFCMYSHTKIVGFRAQQAKTAAAAIENGVSYEEKEPLKNGSTVDGHSRV